MGDFVYSAARRAGKSTLARELARFYEEHGAGDAPVFITSDGATPHGSTIEIAKAESGVVSDGAQLSVSTRFPDFRDGDVAVLVLKDGVSGKVISETRVPVTDDYMTITTPPVVAGKTVTASMTVERAGPCRVAWRGAPYRHCSLKRGHSAYLPHYDVEQDESPPEGEVVWGDDAPKPTTVEEFERQYAGRSNVTIGWLHENGRRGVPCDCGSEGCDGFQMTHGNASPGRTEAIDRLAKGLDVPADIIAPPDHDRARINLTPNPAYFDGESYRGWDAWRVYNHVE